MAVEVRSRKIVKFIAPLWNVVHLVRFRVPGHEPMCVKELRPWPHPWNLVGYYSGNQIGGCELLVYTHDIDVIYRGWPDAEGLEIVTANVGHYTFTRDFQPYQWWFEFMAIPCKELGYDSVDLRLTTPLDERWGTVLGIFARSGRGVIEEIISGARFVPDQLEKGDD